MKVMPWKMPTPRQAMLLPEAKMWRGMRGYLGMYFSRMKNMPIRRTPKTMREITMAELQG